MSALDIISQCNKSNFKVLSNMRISKKNIASRFQGSAVGYLMENTKSKSNKSAKMVLNRSPEILRPHSQFYFVASRAELTRSSSCPYSASSPHSLMPCLLTDQNFDHRSKFRKQFFKRVTHFYEINSKSDQRFQRSRFFKNLFMSV